MGGVALNGGGGMAGSNLIFSHLNWLHIDYYLFLCHVFLISKFEFQILELGSYVPTRDGFRR
mgnify:FL=1